MNKLHSIYASLLVAAASLSAVTGAQAQASTSTSSMGNPMFAAGNSYIGLTAGRSDFSLGNGTGLFPAEKRDTAYGISAGSYFSNNIGVELGYTDFGQVDRAGGRTKAQGINLSVVGRLPLSTSWNLLGKLGTTYSHTNVSALAGSGISAGSESGFGVSAGLGVEYVLSTQWSALLQYETHDMKFAGGNRDRVNVTSLGARYRF